MSQGHAAAHDDRKARFKAWLVVLMIVLYILLYGFIVFFAVGDRGSSDWNFGAVRDVPGQSPYSTAKYKTDYLDE